VDWDNDGRPDLVISTLGGPPILLHNRSTSGNHWLTLRLQGTRGNRDGFGAQVRLKAGGRTWTAEARCPTTYVFQQDPRLHFGLGQQRQADEIQVQWPNGQKQVLTNVPADQILRVEEPK
jgi:hypothetical protein